MGGVILFIPCSEDSVMRFYLQHTVFCKCEDYECDKTSVLGTVKRIIIAVGYKSKHLWNGR